MNPGIQRELQRDEPRKLPPCKNHMHMPQFMDAIVALATLKYPEDSQFPRDAVCKLYSEHFQSFSAETPTVCDEWIQVMEYAAAPLYQIYVHYFPLEMNPHYKETYTVCMARAAARDALRQLVEDYELAPKYTSKTADCSHALRHAFHYPVPQVIVDTIRLPYGGKEFTFHHFLVMLQALANVLKGPEVDLQLPKPGMATDGQTARKAPREYWYQRKNIFSPRAAMALRILLTQMDTTRRPVAPSVRIMPPEEHTKDLDPVVLENA